MAFKYRKMLDKDGMHTQGQGNHPSYILHIYTDASIKAYYMTLSLSTPVLYRDSHIGPDGFSSRDDICRGMVLLLKCKVTCDDLFHIYLSVIGLIG